MFSVVKNDLGNLREYFGQMETEPFQNLFVKTKHNYNYHWNKELQLLDINELHVRLRYNKTGKSLVNLPIV